MLWELPASGKAVKEALSPVRAMEHLDLLLTYHGLDYVDAFVMEIPSNAGGEVRIHARAAGWSAGLFVPVLVISLWVSPFPALAGGPQGVCERCPSESANNAHDVFLRCLVLS